MKAQSFSLIKYEAEDNKVFDWKEPRYIENENGEQEQEHLYVKTLFIGGNDNINNYIEVDEPATEESIVV